MKYIFWLMLFGLAIGIGTHLGAQATPLTETVTVSGEVERVLTPSLPTISALPVTEATTARSEPSTTATATLPTTYQIASVPFIQQAPHQNWDQVHEETCEEAAVLTVVHYLRGDRAIDVDTQEQELQSLIAWQNDRFGNFEDTTADQTAEILKDYFDYGDRVHVVSVTNQADLSALIASGRPVIVPTAGRLLNNRYFKQPGPIYHMTVAIGYDDADIITNDPGTRHGAGYRYPRAQFWEAIHDFVDRTDEGMASGAKRVIVVDPF